MSNVIIHPDLQDILKGYKTTISDGKPKATLVTTKKQSGEDDEAKSSARGTYADVVFDGTDITKDIRPYLLSITYTDNEEDATDDLQITLQDRDKLWLNKWLDAAINAALKPRNDGKTDQNAGKITAATVNAKSGLILRAGKSKSTKRLTAAPYGTKIEVTDPTGDWWACNYGGQSGYMWYSYLTPIDPNASTGSTSSNKKDKDTKQTAPAPKPVPRGFPIQATIHRTNWNGSGDEKLDCGEFELDSVDVSGPPSVVTIKGTSLPFSAPIRQTKKTKAWENYELCGIGAEIAANADMSYFFLSEYNPILKREEQSEESDIEFLSRLTHNAGLSLKCTNNGIVVFDQLSYERMKSVMTITKNGTNYLKYKLTTGQAGTKYASARVSYTKPDGTLIEGIAKVEDYKEDKKNNQQLEIHQKVESIAEAKELAEKLLRNHNKYSKTATFTFPGEPKLVAGVTVDLNGFGPWDGKYMVSQAKHSLGSSGYTTVVNLRNVLEAY